MQVTIGVYYVLVIHCQRPLCSLCLKQGAFVDIKRIAVSRMYVLMLNSVRLDNINLPNIRTLKMCFTVRAHLGTLDNMLSAQVQAMCLISDNNFAKTVFSPISPGQCGESLSLWDFTFVFKLIASTSFAIIVLHSFTVDMPSRDYIFNTSK